MKNEELNFRQVLKKALERRSSLFTPSSLQKTDAFRLCDGETEGIPGLVIDKYGPVAIFQVFEHSSELSLEQLKLIAEWILSETSIESIYLKDFIRDRSQGDNKKEHYLGQAFAGKPAPPEILCKENGVVFEIHPYDGFSCGLFLDQRNNRLFIRQKSNQGSRVLNLFSYTCAFSVMAALGGAQTTSVDLSKKAIGWGKRNFQLNGIDPEAHRFYADDVFEVIKRSLRKNDVFDVVVIDPPSFSRGKKNKVWSLRKDYLGLLEEILPLVRKEGMCFFSCNLSDWDSESLWMQSEPILMRSGNWKRVSLPESPLDFAQANRRLSQWAAIKL